MSNQYETLLQHVLVNGRHKPDRTGTGTREVLGAQMRFNLAHGFPLVTTKKVHLKSVIAELLWFLSGSTNVKDLQAMGCTIWDEWAGEDGNLGPIYGEQWRNWQDCNGGHIDQIQQLVDGLKRDPFSRRHIVSAWNPGDIPEMALAPCHCLFQFEVSECTQGERIAHLDYTRDRVVWDEVAQTLRAKHGVVEDDAVRAALDAMGVPRLRLSCQLYQRSADMFLGVPFNIASYALLTHMVAQQVGMVVGDFVWTGGCVHIYDNHLEQVNTQLDRKPYPYPLLRIKRKPDNIYEYSMDDFEVIGYESHPAIKAPVAV